MPITDDLGKRMKENYEFISQTKLLRRTPVAIRIDGKSFHTFTKKFKKPFDDILIDSMQQTMKCLCENIQGCVLGYTQSDEITLILQDYATLSTDAFFGYEVQKICSIVASMATLYFNKAFESKIRYLKNVSTEYYDNMQKASLMGAVFDTRCFNIPKEEVTNLIYWRQLDATRNSIQMVAQANFSHKELQNKSCKKLQDMLMLEKGVNWNDLPTWQKRGSCCIKKDSSWYIDKNIPIFKNEDRVYIDNLILINEEER